MGWIIAGSLAGVIAELLNYHSVFYVALAMTAGAVWCLWRIKDV
ncbi:Sugar efflux transporter B [Cronobacter turicensis 564]|nr:Sugar efflux transporter B [Cronobacter turicensis 564]